MDEKACTKCGETKPVGDGVHFGWQTDVQMRAGGRWKSECRPCKAEYNLPRGRKYRVENPEKKQESNRKHYEKNPHFKGTFGALKRTKLSDEELFEGLTRAEANAELAFDYRLAKLLSEKMGEPYEIDHYPVSISNGGVHRLHNIRIVTRTINRSGGDHSADGHDLEDNRTDDEIEAEEAETLAFNPKRKELEFA